MDERATFPREYTVSRGVPIIKRVYLSCLSEADIAPAGHITFRATEHIVEKRPTLASWSFFWSE